MSKHLIAALLLALSTLAFPPLRGFAGEPAHEDHDRIRGLAEAHARQAFGQAAPAGAVVQATAARLDPRLRLPACAMTPETFNTPGQRGANTTVGVRCGTGAGWSLYVPVYLEIMADVLLLTMPAARGVALSAADLKVEPRNIAQLTGGYLSSVSDADGLILRRAAQPGTVLTAAMLERPQLVRRGERVRIRAGAGSISVGGEGEALADGAAGDRVRVRNTRSGLIIEATVESAGLVATSR